MKISWFNIKKELRHIFLSWFIVILLIFGMAILSLFFSFVSKVEYGILQTLYYTIAIFSVIVFIRYISLLIFSFMAIIDKTYSVVYADRYRKRRVTIVVPAYNEEVVILKALKSLKRQTYPNLEILVVDDGSTDRTYIKAKHMEFEKGRRRLVVYRKKNGGKANAINYGIGRATGELIVVVDADSRLKENAIELMVPYFEDPDMAAVAGSVYVANRNNWLTQAQALEYIEGLNMVRMGQAFFKMVNIVPGPLGMFRKKYLYKVGLYDSDTFAEDCDLTLKLLMAGYKVDYEPDAIAYTEAPDDLVSFVKQRYRWTRGILQAIKKHKHHLWNLRKPRMSFILWYMIFEGLLWPFMDILNAILLVFSFFIIGGVSIYLFYWWLFFTLMDMVAALYSIMVTAESLSLIWIVLVYRLFFILFTNLQKVLASLEEFLGVKMGWNKLARKGAI